MIQVTDVAREKILEFLREEGGEQAIRVAIAGRVRGAFEYDISMVEKTERAEDDVVVDAGGFEIYVDKRSAPSVEGATIDYTESPEESGFKVDNPNPLWASPAAEKVQEVIEREINPGVAGHGGWVELLDVQDDTAFVRLGGGCQGCGMANVTLKQGIEVAIKRAVPAIQRVLDTTDHASGANPYYQPAKGGASPFAG